MKILLVCALGFLASLTNAQSTFLPSNEESFSEVISEKLGKSSGNKNIITDAIVNQILNIYAPVSDGFDNDLCRSHGELYKEGVKKGELWALRMIDASSKIPEGILSGNIVQLGNFDECVQTENVPSDFGPFSGQHCLVSTSFSPVNDIQRTALERIRELSMEFLNPSIIAPDSLEKLDNKAGEVSVPYQWSICVPSSCRPQDIQLHLQTALPGGMSVKVTENHCYSRAHDYPFSGADWFAVGFMAFFAILVVLSTSYDLINLHSESRKPVLAAFSVYSNGAKILSSPTNSPDNLPCLHGVRFLSMAWVVLGHRYLFYALTPSINRFVLLDYYQDWNHIFITNASVSVDSFFLLSGILVCYIFMKEMEKGTNFNIFLYYIHRYVRLTPPYAVVILLTATLFKYMGEGPLWQSVAATSSFPCQDKWWVGLLYVNNYVRPLEQCVGPAWYIAVDMQLFWLSPLVLLPLWKWPKVGKALLGVLIGVGLLIAFLVAYINEFPAVSGSGGDAGTKEYYPTHTRFTPWLIGIGLGYFLHTTKKTKMRLSKLQVALGWFLSFGLLLTSWLLAHRFFQLDHQYERAFESIYTCLMRPSWAVGLGWVVFACVKGYGGFINTFLSWSVFQVLSRLTYSVYLIHFTFMIWDYGTTKVPIYLSDRSAFLQYFGDLVIIFTAAFVLSVVFESPAIILERYFLGGLGKKADKPAKKEDVEEKLKEDLKEIDKSSTIEHEEVSTQSTSNLV